MDRPEKKWRRWKKEVIQRARLSQSQTKVSVHNVKMQRRTETLGQKVVRQRTSAWPNCEHGDVMLHRCLNSHSLQNKPLHVQRLSFIYLNCVSAEEGMTEEITECRPLPMLADTLEF